MRLLLDQGAPRSAADLLADAGHDAIHVGPIGLGTADDQTTLAFARADDRVVVTLDADFHAILASSRASSPSVIRVSIEGLRAPDFAALVTRILRTCAADLARGAAVTVRARRIGVRLLPLPSPRRPDVPPGDSPDGDVSG